jgi:hypothetical protein
MALLESSWTVCFWRFRKIPGYHSFLAKLTGLPFPLGVLALLFAGRPIALANAIWIFVASLVEEVAMTAVLRRYEHDLWSLAAARRSRQE